MRKFAIGAIALFVLLATALSVTAAPAEHKVTGGGWFMFPSVEEKVTLSFTAQSDAEGNVKGQIQVQDRSGLSGIRTFHAAVTSLEMIGDNGAAIEGIVTKAEDPSFVGMPVYVEVYDNGEGKIAVDTVWGFIPFNGNIQVR